MNSWHCFIFSMSFISLLVELGLGKAEGGQGNRSNGDPFKTEFDLPSPIQFHTKAVGQSMVIT